MKKYNIFTLSLIFITFLTYTCFLDKNQVANAQEFDSNESNEINILSKNNINKKIDDVFNDEAIVEDTKSDIKDKEEKKKEIIEEEIEEKINEEAKEKTENDKDEKGIEEIEEKIEEEEITKEDKEIVKEDIQEKKIEILDKRNNEKEIVGEKKEIKEDKNAEKAEAKDKNEEKIEKKEEVKEEKKEEININSLSYNDIKGLGRTLRTGEKKEREKALQILNKLGKKALPATNDIIASIHEKKTGKEAVDILCNIGTDPAIAGLARLVSNDDITLGEYILKKIASFKNRAQFVVDDIFANYSKKEFKEEVIYALGEIKGERSYYELREIIKGSESDKIKILALNQLLKYDDVKKDLPLFRRIFRKTSPSDFTLQLSNAIMKLEGSNF